MESMILESELDGVNLGEAVDGRNPAPVDR